MATGAACQQAWAQVIWVRLDIYSQVLEATMCADLKKILLKSDD
jgi:hypothetical protein